MARKLGIKKRTEIIDKMKNVLTEKEFQVIDMAMGITTGGSVLDFRETLQEAKLSKNEFIDIETIAFKKLKSVGIEFNTLKKL